MLYDNGYGVGFFAISGSGHDRGKVYVVTKVLGGQFALVADGKGRTFEKPKRKNVRHLSITKTRVADFERLVAGEAVSSNLKLAALIKEFQSAEKRGSETRCRQKQDKASKGVK